MQTLKQYQKRENHIIAGVVDDEGKLLGFTIADNNLERVTDKLFETANFASKWSDDNFKTLL